MIKKVRKVALILSMLAVSMLPAAIPVTSYADSASSTVCTAIGSSADCGGGSSKSALNSTVRIVIDILSTIVGVAAVIMIIVGGFRYISSGGDSNKVGSAKSTIIYAIIGLILVALAQIIVNVVITRSTAATTPCPSNSAISTSDPNCKG